MLKRASSLATTTADRVSDTLAASHDEPHPAVHSAITPPPPHITYSVAGTTASMVGIILIGFLGHAAGISHIRHDREQYVLTEEFRYALANGSAPVAQIDAEGAVTTSGTAIALMSFPAIGLESEIVVEGTTSRNLVDGVGHRRDTVLPGQQGTAVLYGRQNTYGAPFAALSQAHIGDTITVVTGQGEAAFRVSAVRRGAEPPATLTTGQSRLTLVSAAGISFFPTDVVRVDAINVGTSFPTPQTVLLPGSLDESEATLGTDDSGYLPLFLLAELALLCVFVGVWLRKIWGLWATYIVVTPILLVLGVVIAEQIIILLPNLY